MSDKFTEAMTALKPMSYGTRRLSAGDLFQARPSHVRLLEAVGKARRGRPASEVPAPPARVLDAVRHPLDHDGDGRPGGSVARRRKKAAAGAADRAPAGDGESSPHPGGFAATPLPQGEREEGGGDGESDPHPDPLPRAGEGEEAAAADAGVLGGR